MAQETRILIKQSDALSYLASPIVKIVVGNRETSTCLFVHEELILQRYPYFQEALISYRKDEIFGWIEGAEKTIKLSEDNPEVVTLYIQLLYQNCLPVYKEISHAAKMDRKALCAEVAEATAQGYELLAELYVFCEKIQDVTFQNMVLQSFFEAAKRIREDEYRYYPPLACINCVFHGTRESDPLRELLVDFTALKGHLDWWGGITADRFHPDFLCGVVKTMLKLRESPKDCEKIENASNYLNDSPLSKEMKGVKPQE